MRTTVTKRQYIIHCLFLLQILTGGPTYATNVRMANFLQRKIVPYNCHEKRLISMYASDLVDRDTYVPCLVVSPSTVENAYCESDGTIVVTEGMLRLFENEDELAVVVAHEMGHLIAKHKGAHNPEKEMEADRIGLELMAKAGYDPNAAVEFWTRYYERIGWWEGDGTHQEPHERIETLMHFINERKTTNEKSKSVCCDRYCNICNLAATDIFD